MSSKYQNGSYNHAVDNKQQQTQTQKLSEKQEQAQIRYYIYEDLQNIINLIYSRKAVLECFKDDPAHEMVTLSNNKLILQLNLSSSIHFDQTQYYKNQQKFESILKEERKEAYKILEKLFGDNDQKMNQKNNSIINSKTDKKINQDDHLKKNKEIEDDLKKYKENYKNQYFQLNQFKQQPTNLVPKFTEGVLSKIISSIQTVDSQVDQIRNTQYYKTPDYSEIQQKAQNYYELTKLKLQEHVPNLNNQMTIKDNQKIAQSKIINIGQSSNVIQGQEMNQSLSQSDSDEQPNLQNQQNKGIYLKEKLIEFINYLRFNNVEIIKSYQSNNNTTEQHFNIQNLLSQFYNQKEVKQWELCFKRQELLQQLINLHYQFYLFVEYQKCINKARTPQNNIDLYNSFMNNQQGKNTISIPYLLGYLFYQKDNHHIQNYQNYLQHNANSQNQIKKADQKQNQLVNQEQDHIYSLYEIFCTYYNPGKYN